MSVAFVFPGQGSQAVGMGQELASRFPVVAETLETAERLSGVPLHRLCSEGPAEVLQQTENAQLALLAVETGIARLLHSCGLVPAMAAGHSLGEYPALVAAGAMTLDQATRLVKRRGELMAASGRRAPGAMAAVLGFDPARLAALCEGAAAVVAVANDNGGEQLVISGSPEGVTEVAEKARAEGAKRVIPLAVSGAFHSPLMAEPAREFAPVLAAETFCDPRIPVFANLDARPYTRGAEVALKLTAQLDHAVRWREVVLAMGEAGATRFVEVGPGRVLSGLVKKILPGVEVLNVADTASLEKTLAACGLEVGS